MSEEKYTSNNTYSASEEAVRRYERKTKEEIDLTKRVRLIQLWGLLKSLDEVINEPENKNDSD